MASTNPVSYLSLKQYPLSLTYAIQSDKKAASSITELERAHQMLGRTQEQPGRADPGTGQLARSPTTPKFSHVPSGMDSLNAYIQTTDHQRGILDSDQQFLAFQRANPWGMYNLSA